jgi:hypothetical protein
LADRVFLVSGATGGIRPSCRGSVDAGPIRADDRKLSPADVARAVMHALSQPEGVDANEVVIRPTGQSR